MAEYREEAVVRGYWQCNVLSHRHRSADAAESCAIRRGGVKGMVRQVRRDLPLIAKLMAGLSLEAVGKACNCSASNVIKAANSSLLKAYQYAQENGGYPFSNTPRRWTTTDFRSADKITELSFLVHVLEEYLDSLLREDTP